MWKKKMIKKNDKYNYSVIPLNNYTEIEPMICMRKIWLKGDRQVVILRRKMELQLSKKILEKYSFSNFDR